MNGPLGDYCSAGGMRGLGVLRSHGGRWQAIQDGEVHIDIAVIAAPTADPFGNATARRPVRLRLAGLRPRRLDLRRPRHRRHRQPRALPLHAVADPGQQRGLRGGGRLDRRPREDRLRHHRDHEEPDRCSSPSYVARFCATPASCATASRSRPAPAASPWPSSIYLKDMMKAAASRRASCAAAPPSTWSTCCEEGLTDYILDGQTFDLDGVRSIATDPRHVSDTSPFTSYNYHGKGNFASMVDVRGARRDRGRRRLQRQRGDPLRRPLLHGIGGWQNCLFGRCTILPGAVFRDRIPVIVDEVTTLTGPGELIDVVVTERGIAINPRRQDLLGTSLQRRGAEFGEPVPGLGDNSSDVVVEDAPGDMSVRISDTTSALGQSDGDLLYFAFTGGRAVGDGKLYASCEFLPESFDVYEFSVRPSDFGPSFFELTLDGAGLVYRLDGDTNNEQMIGLSYVAGVPLELEVVFDLDAGTYDFWFGGVLVLDDEPHGRGLGELVGGLVVGNQSDGNATGSVRVDDLTVSWVPGTANELLVANFNDKPLGQPIQTRGATFGEPTSVTGGVTAIVRGSVTPTPSLEIADDGIDEDDDGLVVFTNRGNVTIDEGSLSVRMTLLFDSIEGWEIRMPGLDLEVHTAGGNLVLYDVSSGFDVEVGRHPYSIGFPYKLEFAFEFDFGQFVWWVADERIGHEVSRFPAARPGCAP
jgi:hypothetical protein